MSRWGFAISTSALVHLFTIGATIAFEWQNYLLLAFFLLIQFVLPLLDEAMRDELIKSEAGTGSDAGISRETDREISSE